MYVHNSDIIVLFFKPFKSSTTRKDFFMILIPYVVQMNTISMPANAQYCEFVGIDVVTRKVF